MSIIIFGFPSALNVITKTVLMIARYGLNIWVRQILTLSNSTK